jgi:hypothetical protein
MVSRASAFVAKLLTGHTVAPQDRLPPLLDDRRGAGRPVCPTLDTSERHVPEVLQFREFSPVVRKEIEEVASRPAHPVVPRYSPWSTPRRDSISTSPCMIKVRSTFSRDILERSIA